MHIAKDYRNVIFLQQVGAHIRVSSAGNNHFDLILFCNLNGIHYFPYVIRMNKQCFRLIEETAQSLEVDVSPGMNRSSVITLCLGKILPDLLHLFLIIIIRRYRGRVIIELKMKE